MNPLLISLPETLETKRLVVRCPRPGDGKAVNEALHDSWADLQVWMHWAAGSPPPFEDTETRNIRQIADWKERNGLHFNLYLKDGAVFVGKCSLFRFDWDVPKGEIGYWLRSAYTGQGYMTEAVHAVEMLALETLGLVRVEIRCDPKNLRSASIAERLGYTKEACLHNDSRTPTGSLRDTLIYAKTRG